MIEYKKYFEFSGKSTRSEYWAINLIGYFAVVVCGFLSTLFIMAGILGIIFSIALILAVAFIFLWLIFAVTTRRCRDIGISPLFSLSLLIPYLAIVPFIVFGCIKSEEKENGRFDNNH